MKIKTRTYWENDNGAIYCENHLGSYMTAAITANPKARTHHTPLGTWYRLTATEIADFQAYMTEHQSNPECCETCRR